MSLNQTKTYDFMWERVIKPQIKNIAQFLEKSYAAKQNCNFEIRGLTEYKEVLFTSFNKTKKDLEEKFFYMVINQNGDGNCIDIHKVSACFCKSVIENKIFRFKLIDNIPDQIFLCNYWAAFSISLGVMYLNLLAEYMRDEKIDQYNKLKEQKQFYFPPTNLGHDSYPFGRIKALALNDIYGIDFDLLAYADMMYWIEDYNKSMLEE